LFCFFTAFVFKLKHGLFLVLKPASLQIGNTSLALLILMPQTQTENKPSALLGLQPADFRAKPQITGIDKDIT
jgi:hypothetical protein